MRQDKTRRGKLDRKQMKPVTNWLVSPPVLHQLIHFMAYITNFAWFRLVVPHLIRGKVERGEVRDGHEASLLAARLTWLASWRASGWRDSLASPWGEASWSGPHSCTSEGQCLALVSEANNDTVSPRFTSPRLICLAIHSVTYRYIALGKMHAFRMLRSPCHQRLPCHQRPPCPQSALDQQTASPGPSTPPLCLQTAAASLTTGCY